MYARLLISLIATALFAGCQSADPAAGPATNRDHQPAVSSSSDQGDAQPARLYVKGMSCPLCAHNINKQLLRVPGVEKVSVNLGTGVVLATISAASPPSREQLADAINESGFTLDRIEMPGEQEADNE